MKHQWSRGEKWLMVGSVLLCLPGLVGSWIYQRQNELPLAPAHVEEVPPSDNAFDLLTQAMAVAPARPSPPYGKSNCKSFEVDREYACISNSGLPLPYTPQYNAAFPLKQKTAYLKTAQSSLKLWRDSLALPLYVSQNPPPSNPTYRTITDHLQQLVLLQARACWQRGDTDAALNWLLAWHQDTCRSTRSFFNGQSHPVEIDDHWKFSNDLSKVIDELELLMPYLNASQLRRASLAIGHNRALVPSLTEATKQAKEKGMDRLYRACATNDVFLLRGPKYERPEGVTLPLRFRWANKKLGLEHISNQWDWLITQTRKPFSVKQTRNFPDELILSANDPFGVAIVPVWVLKAVPRPEGREVVLQTAMAAQAFALEHGRNVRTLDELVPRYLQEVEIDPFNAPHPLRYSPLPKTYNQFRYGGPIYTLPLPKSAVRWAGTATTQSFPNRKMLKGFHTFHTVERLPFLLYSVGENGRDDGGMDFKKATNRAYYDGLSNSNSHSNDFLARAELFKKPVFSELSKSLPYGTDAP